MSDKRPDPAPSEEELGRRLGFDDEKIAARRTFFEIGPTDEAALGTLGPFANDHLDQLVADFYAHLLRFPEMEELLRAEAGRVSKLQQTQRAYFQRVTEGRIDREYFESRLRVGNAHQRIGLRPEWYIGGFGLFLRLVVRTLLETAPAGRAPTRLIEAVIKVVFLDMSLAIDTYIHGGFVDRGVASELQKARSIAEDALRVKQETELLKDDLTRMVVHDLKNPVNGILMMAQLALRKGDDLPETHRGYLQQIDRTCREMMRLIQNLLEISKIEDGKMPVERELVPIAELGAQILRDYGPVAEGAGRRVELDVRPETLAVAADSSLLRRVLVNLVTNALRHSGSSVVSVVARAGEREGWASIEVRDRGQGIPEADLPYIFEKFRTRRRAASDAPSTDTGLGLPFCKLAIELMGGRISVESRAGVETVFKIALPTRHA